MNPAELMLYAVPLLPRAAGASRLLILPGFCGLFAIQEWAPVLILLPGRHPRLANLDRKSLS